jgi:SAM-dependent methyltransferase
MNEWWRYEQLSSRWPYDWAPATRGDRPWDQLDFHLDLGCGRVPKARMGIDRKFSEGATDLVIDLDEIFLYLMESERSGHRMQELLEFPGERRLPFPTGSIESIITHHCFEHIGEGFERLMEECYRVLKWGGVMRIVTPVFPSSAAVSEYDHKRYFMQGTLMGFCQELPGGASIYDAFAERYNSCCFRQIDEEVSPPTPAEKQWTTEDVREIRTTLWKFSDGEDEPEPSMFIPEETNDFSPIQAGQGDHLRGDDDGLGAAEPGGNDQNSGEPAQTESGDGDEAALQGPSEAAQRVDQAGGGGGPSPFASVCVLSYERLSLLRECIGSMLAGAHSPFELIVHDDGSRDPELRQWLLQMSEEGVISTLLMNSPGWNEGQGIAMNRMAAVAKGDPIIKCDQDLVFEPGWLRRVQEVLNTNARETHETGEPMIGALGIFKYFTDPVDHERMFLRDWISYDEVLDFVGSFIAIPRTAWEIFGPWGERSAAFAEDAVFKDTLQKTEGWCCALTKEDLARNQGFGVGPSTVVVAEGTVQAIQTGPKVIEPGVIE